MADGSNEAAAPTSSELFDFSIPIPPPPPPPLMGTPLVRRAFGCISGLARPCRNQAGAASPHDRDRIFRADVEQEEQFQYAKTHCLSSYYSIFVARLAIMVCINIEPNI